jgi:hypothetical protein
VPRVPGPLPATAPRPLGPTVHFARRNAPRASGHRDDNPPQVHDLPGRDAAIIHSPPPPSAPKLPSSSTWVRTGGSRETPFRRTEPQHIISPPDDAPAHVPIAPRTIQPTRARPGLDEDDARATQPRPASGRVRQQTPLPDPSTLAPARAKITPPPTKTRRAPSGKHRAVARGPSAGGVVVSRPAVIIGGPGDSTSRRTRPRAAREAANPESLFAQDLISEKSLDEVILAYLSEDSSDD